MSESAKQEWSFDDPSDSACSRYCDQNGCPENHPTGTYVVDGPEWDLESSFGQPPRLLSASDAALIAAAPDLYEALKPFARLAEDDVLQIIAANLAPLVSFLTFTDADGKEVARVTLDDLHKARAALLRAQASEQSGAV